MNAIAQTVRAQLARSGSANIANCLLKRGLRKTMMLGLSPVAPDQPAMVGPAWTVRFIPARVLYWIVIVAGCFFTLAFARRYWWGL